MVRDVVDSIVMAPVMWVGRWLSVCAKAADVGQVMFRAFDAVRSCVVRVNEEIQKHALRDMNMKVPGASLLHVLQSYLGLW